MFHAKKEVYLLMHATTPPSVSGTDTTSVHIPDDASSTAPPPARLQGSQRITVKLAPAPMTPAPALPSLPNERADMIPRTMHFNRPNETAQKFDSSHLQLANIDVLFDGWESESVKAMVIAKLTGPHDDDFEGSYDESQGDTQLDTLSESADVQLPLHITTRVDEWLKDLSEQPQVFGSYDDPWNGSAIDSWDE
jgi:hypothetical protein